MTDKKKTVIITGGTGALGSRVAARFLEEGYNVFIGDLNEDNILKMAESSGGKLKGCSVNLMDEKSVIAMTDRAVKEFGSIEVLINTVGGWTGGKDISETDLGDLEKMINLNLKTAFLSCKHAFAHMKKNKSGCILNIGSIAANSNSATTAPYAASKAAVISLTRAIAEEGKVYGITANSLLPAMLDTPANRAGMPDADFSKWVKPDDIANLMLHLASDSGKAISGEAISVPGGQL